MLQLLKCLETEFNHHDELIEPQQLTPNLSSTLHTFNDEVNKRPDVLLIAPSNLFELIKWLSPAFHLLEICIQRNRKLHKRKHSYSMSNKLNHALHSRMTSSRHSHRHDTFDTLHKTNAINWVIDGLPSLDTDDEDDDNKINVDYYPITDDDIDIDDDKEVEEHSYYRKNGTVTFIDDNEMKSYSDADSTDNEETRDTKSDIINIGVLLSEKYEHQMIECRLVSLLKISELRQHIFPDGLLKDIVRIIVDFELGMSDIYEFTIRFLNSEILDESIASYIAYYLGIYESLCLFGVVLMHCFQMESLIFVVIISTWSVCLAIHIMGAVVLWRRGHSIANRLRQLKIAMRVSSMKNTKTMDDYDEKDFEDIHIGEAFVRLQRWCNLSEIRLNDKFNSIKILMLVLQKYILPLSISLCILIDPNGSKWYGYISILLYYLHLHILYEIFHNERHAMVAFARVTLFWGIFISIVAAIASATSSHASTIKESSSSSSSQEANFLAGLAGLLLFGIFIAVFDVCWFFSENPAKKRLIFFVILVNFCYIGGCFYMFDQSIIIIAFFFTISLVHCQIVFNQIIDCVLFGDVDQYLDLNIPNNFFIHSYYQSFCGMTNANNVQCY